MIGQTIGKYRITGQLGRGATGIVYRATDTTLDRDVAIKVLNPDLANPDIIKRFRVEATTLARLNHPEIATIHELIPSGSDLLMVMELVRGETLDGLLERVGPMSPELAARIIDRILLGLEHAHRAGIVHRDMKPANVMVTTAGGVKIMDFGIARVRGAEHMTVDGLLMGTPAYMAPEQGLGEEVDERTDLYAVGVMFYRLLTGALPFFADSPIAMLRRKVVDAPRTLRQQREGLPEWCETVVQRALAHSPADRFQTAEEFRDALRGAMGLDATTDIAKVFAVREVAGTPAISRTETIVPAAASGPRKSAARPARHRPQAAGLAGRRNASVAQGGAIVAILIASAALLAWVAPRHPAKEQLTAPASPPLVFEAKTLVGNGDRQREPDAQLLLSNGNITVIAGGDTERPLYSGPYRTVRSISYSRSTDPMWKSPDGPARAARVRGGVLGDLGIFTERHWISLRTADDRFVILRVGDPIVRPVLAALEERTGRTVERVR